MKEMKKEAMLYGTVIQQMSRTTAALCLGAALLLPVSAAAAVMPGSIAIYSDGSVEKLLSRANGKEVWQDSRYRRLTRSSNPLLPVLSRESLGGERNYSHFLRSGDPDMLLNAPAGRSHEFVVLRRDKYGNLAIKPRHFECVVNGDGSIRIAGKPEKVKRFTCERFTLHHKLLTKSIKETLALAYSPRLKMVVDTQRTTPKKSSRKSLVKLIAPGKHSYRTLRAELKALQADKQEGVK